MYSKWSKHANYELILCCASSRNDPIKNVSKFSTSCDGDVILAFLIIAFVVLDGFAGFAYILFRYLLNLLQTFWLQKRYAVRKGYRTFQVIPRKNQVSVVALLVISHHQHPSQYRYACPRNTECDRRSSSSRRSTLASFFIRAIWSCTLVFCGRNTR